MRKGTTTVHDNGLDYWVRMPDTSLYEMNADANMPNGVCIWHQGTSYDTTNYGPIVPEKEWPKGIRIQVERILSEPLTR